MSRTIFFLFVLCTANVALAFSGYATAVPSTATPVCRTCHNNDSGGGGCATPPCLNPFGSAFQGQGHVWTRALAGADSDGDGWTNGQELGDPFATWVAGQAARSFVSTPGNGGSEPGDFDLCGSGYSNCAGFGSGGSCSSNGGDGTGTWTCGCRSGFSGPAYGTTTGGGVPYTIVDSRTQCSDVPECSNGATCNSQGGRAGCNELAGTYQCICLSGFTAPGTGGTCSDVPECSNGATCNGQGGRAGCNELAGTYQCVCRSGFTAPATGGDCAVNDACTANTDNCVDPSGGGVCMSTGGSGFNCSCMAGYTGNGTVVPAGTGCTDVDECSTAGRCGTVGTCANLPGTYRCDCPTGYQAPATGGMCVDIDECVTNPTRCGVGTCGNTPGAFICNCPPGYAFTGGTCVDIDECAPMPCGVGMCSQTPPPGYVCACPSGWLFDGTTCVDIDECADPLVSLCSADATCANSPGSFTCTCNMGYEGDGRTCTDIDECMRANECDANASCTNRIGSYSCTCNMGYRGSGVTCADIDECLDGTGGCGTNELCVNQVGVPNLCVCQTGYARQGTMCVAVCGDGVLTQGQECDDGNMAAGDGCGADCAIEEGYACIELGGPSQCARTCGDGLVQGPAEECDDAANNDDVRPDACRTTCRFAHCGDGVLDTGEQCDDGASNDDTRAGACRTTCETAYCGDGVVDVGEICDRGGGVSGVTPAGACTTACTSDGGVDPNDPPVLTGGSCGCRVASPRTGLAWLAILPIVLVALRRSRRRA